MPSNMLRMRRLRSSCEYVKYHPGLCCPITISEVSSDSVGRLEGPYQTELSAYSRRHVFAWRDPYLKLMFPLFQRCLPAGCSQTDTTVFKSLLERLLVGLMTTGHMVIQKCLIIVDYILNKEMKLNVRVDVTK